MMTFVAILVVWILGSALFVMALAAATKNSVMGADIPAHGRLETAESILERLHLLKGRPCGLAPSPRHAGTQIH